ncbi:MAG: 50S ribosomal protein L25 [Phycisphaerae bacterium]|nr:50S ribosomal protein L25 [Phycisphaerae bacterium]
MAAVLKATKRDDRGSRKATYLRRAGKVPGVIYGHQLATTAVTLDMMDVASALKHHERLLEIQLEGQSENVLIKDVQYDTFGEKILHIDLTRVNLDEVVEVTVPVVLRGVPAGAVEGGVLQQLQAEVTISVTVRDLPDDIRVSVAEMKVGDRLLAKDLPLPAGAKMLDDAEEIIATVSVVAEETEKPAGEELTQPEVITERKPADGGDTK